MMGLVYIVDDDLLLRKAVSGLLEDAGFVVEACSSAEEFLALEPRYEPCCLLLDVKMDGMSGFDLQTQLDSREFSPPIVFLTGSAKLQQAVSAMRDGAKHFLMKPVDDEHLIETLTEAINQSTEDATFMGVLQQLTPMEKTIAKLSQQGLLSKQIAEKVNTSIRTVEWHRRNIAKKGLLQ
jgi:FixJ family two-component response regulator